MYNLMKRITTKANPPSTAPLLMSHASSINTTKTVCPSQSKSFTAPKNSSKSRSGHTSEVNSLLVSDATDVPNW